MQCYFARKFHTIFFAIRIFVCTFAADYIQWRELTNYHKFFIYELY